GSCVLHNFYGPSEGNIVTVHRLQGTPDQWPPLPSIGRPIANTQVYVLDSDLNPVPAGVTAELFIAGAVLARGYLNRPDMTAEKFIPDPLSLQEGARMYKTGDLARYLPDGKLEFLGRIDHQVKIRGFRVELGEVESVLAQHPAIKEAVVIAREDVAGQKRLVAYVVGDEPGPSAGELKSFLKEKLPEYMVPSAFVKMAEFPLSPNRKVDRKALPAPEQSGVGEREYEPPRNDTEAVVASIWAEVLGLEKVSLHDNFFELGGHSLLATQVVSRIKESLKVQIPLRSIFESPTVAGLARTVIDCEANQSDEQDRIISVRKRTDAEEVLSNLDGLSDEELNALLNDVIAENRLG
ncbi:MAG TPA: phosphopantetheine-binding protein, partial [Blastocatellia bacterium]|nr:phosphopantetheine-binding protein [Blastocatellia bacterium]